MSRINFAMLSKVMGWLLMIESGFMTVPAIVSILLGENDWQALTISTLVTALVGFSLNSRIKPRHSSMHRREGLLLTVMVWVVFSLFGMLPFLLCQHRLSLTNAFFEAMSGFTTTGASTISDISLMGKGMHIWQALMQWIGGMGIIIFTLAVLPMLNHAGGMQMFNAEVTGITHDKIRPRISQTAKSLWTVYLVLTACCALLLWLGPMDLYESVCHAFGTVSTGGFSTQPDGILAWDSIYVKVVIAFFMMLGGINFGLIFRAVTGHWRIVRTNETMRFFLFCILGCTVAIVISRLVAHGWVGWQESTIDPLFQCIAAMTATGYALPDVANWGFFALALMLAMMFFCGCAGSTSGGAKIDRLLVLIKFQRNEIRKSLQPNAITPVRSGSGVIPNALVTKSLAFLTLYMGVVVVAGILLTAMGVPLANAFFSSLSCMSNVGFCTEVIGYTGTFATIPAAGKWVLASVMLIGRLEVYSVFVILSSAFWRR